MRLTSGIPVVCISIPHYFAIKPMHEKLLFPLAVCNDNCRSWTIRLLNRSPPILNEIYYRIDIRHARGTNSYSRLPRDPTETDEKILPQSPTSMTAVFYEQTCLSFGCGKLNKLHFQTTHLAHLLCWERVILVLHRRMIEGIVREVKVLPGQL